MPYFNSRSKENLSQAHEDLQRLFNEVVKTRDCSVISSYREKEEQDELYYLKLSKLLYPDSKHNKIPSLAVDVIPFPVIAWKDIEGFKQFVSIVKKTAKRLNIDIINGGEWELKDYPHYELK